MKSGTIILAVTSFALGMATGTYVLMKGVCDQPYRRTAFKDAIIEKLDKKLFGYQRHRIYRPYTYTSYRPYQPSKYADMYSDPEADEMDREKEGT